MRAEPADLKHVRSARPCEAKTRSGTQCEHATNYECQRCDKAYCGTHGVTHWCERKRVMA